MLVIGGQRARGSAAKDVLHVETQDGGVSTEKVQEKQLHGIIKTVEVLQLPPLEQQRRQGHFHLPQSSLQHEEKSWKGSLSDVKKPKPKAIAAKVIVTGR